MGNFILKDPLERVFAEHINYCSCVFKTGRNISQQKYIRKNCLCLLLKGRHHPMEESSVHSQKNTPSEWNLITDLCSFVPPILVGIANKKRALDIGMKDF
ncbi:hypothetical protein KIL84_020400 [Mauremys mutica]|uniref:Uncharacterized protein n=1 Tax=Mauremys mutica TaxID=74926 RepID=A0A9D4BB61_9SAUR|nr:hypothetical protein KIL84_020400 [Mauremys mutica]